MSSFDEGRTEQAEIVHGEIQQAMGEVSALRVRIEMRVAEVRLGARPGSAYAATGSYRAHTDTPITVDYKEEDGVGVLTVRQPKDSIMDIPPRRWFHSRKEDYLEIDLSDAVPVDLLVDVGVGRVELDLADLNMTGLKIEGGVGSVDVTLPARGEMGIHVEGGVGRVKIERPQEPGEFKLRSLNIHSGVGSVAVEVPSLGDMKLRVDSGVGSIKLMLPDELAARIKSTTGIGSVRIMDERLRQVKHNFWETAGYGEAANRASIDIDTGVGSVSVMTA